MKSFGKFVIFAIIVSAVTVCVAFANRIKDVFSIFVNYEQDKSVINQITDYQKMAWDETQHVKFDTDHRMAWMAQNALNTDTQVNGFVVDESSGMYPWNSMALYFFDKDFGQGQLINEHDRAGDGPWGRFLRWAEPGCDIELTDDEAKKTNKGNFVASQQINYTFTVYFYADKVTYSIDNFHRVLNIYIQRDPLHVVKDFRVDANPVIYFGVGGYADLPLDGVKFSISNELSEKFKIDARQAFEDYADKIIIKNESTYRRSFEEFWQGLDAQFAKEYPSERLGYLYSFHWDASAPAE